MTGTILNGLDVSLYEDKPGFDDSFIVPARGDAPFSITHIHDTEYIMDLGADAGTIRLPESGAIIAKSICEDVRKAMYGYSENHKPFLISFEGELSLEDLDKHKKTIDLAFKSHRNFLKKLVDLADIDYKKYESAAFVSDMQRQAAKDLGIDRAWIQSTLAESVCPACRSATMPGQVVCQKCHCVLNEEAYEKLTFAGHKVTQVGNTAILEKQSDSS